MPTTVGVNVFLGGNSVWHIYCRVMMTVRWVSITFVSIFSSLTCVYTYKLWANRYTNSIVYEIHCSEYNDDDVNIQKWLVSFRKLTKFIIASRNYVMQRVPNPKGKFWWSSCTYVWHMSNDYVTHLVNYILSLNSIVYFTLSKYRSSTSCHVDGNTALQLGVIE